MSNGSGHENEKKTSTTLKPAAVSKGSKKSAKASNRSGKR
jgi:hypothetical protein